MLPCAIIFCFISFYSSNIIAVSFYLLLMHFFSIAQFRMKYFCGVIAETVESKTNVLHVRFFADKGALKSKFTILYTAYREKGVESKYLPHRSHYISQNEKESVWGLRQSEFLARTSYAFTFTYKAVHILPYYLLECQDDEFDCEDGTCINSSLKCNKANNCKFLKDEAKVHCPVSSFDFKNIFSRRRLWEQKWI